MIGDRLLIVDAIQGFGVVDAPYEVADVVVAGGQKWVRAGWGTGFLALSDRAARAAHPGVVAASTAPTRRHCRSTRCRRPTRGAAAFQVSNPDPIAQARLRGRARRDRRGRRAGDQRARSPSGSSRIIDLADEFGIPVVSSRARERAGRDRGAATAGRPAHGARRLAAQPRRHRDDARQGSVRLSAHATTTRRPSTCCGRASRATRAPSASDVHGSRHPRARNSPGEQSSWRVVPRPCRAGT